MKSGRPVLYLRVLLILILLLQLCLFSSDIQGQSEGTPWPGMDASGRVVTTAKEVRAERTIGLFYFLWMLPESNIPSDRNGKGEPYDITKILHKDPTAQRREDDALFGKNGEMHFWGEPLYGYYDSRDPWVIRRHLILLADAGVDVLMFDATNAVHYPSVWKTMLKLMKEMRSEGESTPQITFVLNTRIRETVDSLWKELYSQQEKWGELLFHWEGKPLLLADPNQVDPKIRDHFTFRRTRWQYEGMANMQNAWSWIALYPQPYGWAQNEKIPEEVNVSVAQNLTRFGTNIEARKKVFKETSGWDCPEWLYSFNGKVAGAGLDAWMSDGTARGRSARHGELTPPNLPNEGRNFTEQWSRALELDPLFVMITGWNEWIAGRWKVAGHYIFIDQFNQEYSRDIEPMKGGHFDNYYLQMVNGIRRYKGSPSCPQALLWKDNETVLVINKSDNVNQSRQTGQSRQLDEFEIWNEMKPEFRDHRGETFPRDFSGVGKTYYKDNTGRNDIIMAKVAQDIHSVYFYLRTAKPITPQLPNGLCLLLDTDAKLTTGWNGGDLLIGTHYDLKKVSVEKCIKTSSELWQGEPAGTVEWKLRENEMIIKVPCDLFTELALKKIRFKWLDNLPQPQSTEGLYLYGDVAPESRFFYQIDFKEK